jgi:SAM-dependent methyltransferase
VDRIVSGRSGLEVLDVGCGTGIAARQFQAAGCDVLGIDPDQRMAEYARGRELDVELATFEAWEPAGRSFDVVAAAQSWHWVDPAIGVHKAASVLRPRRPARHLQSCLRGTRRLPQSVAAAFRRVVPDSPFNGRGTRHWLPLASDAGERAVADADLVVFTLTSATRRSPSSASGGRQVPQT